MFNLVGGNLWNGAFIDESFMTSAAVQVFLYYGHSVVDSCVSLNELRKVLPTEVGISFSIGTSDYLCETSGSSTPVVKPQPLVSISSSRTFALALVQIGPSQDQVGSSFAPGFLDYIAVSSPMGPTVGPDTIMSVPELLDAVSALVPLPPPEACS